MSELARRVLVALIAAPIVIAVVWLGDAALATMASVLSAVAAWEFFRLAREGGNAPLAGVGIVGAALLPLVVHAQFLRLVQGPTTALTLVVLALIACALFVRGVSGKPMAAVAITLLGVAYTGGTLSYVYALRYHAYAVGNSAGALVAIFPVLLAWASDVGAYAAGRAIGGPRLMPSVSPGKTVAGAVGGVLLTVLVCALYVHWLLRPYAQLAFTSWGIFAFGLCVSVAAQLGDLAESMLKREAQVKDSGSIFPGHGGALDRLDSVFFVLPVAYVLYDALLVAAPA